MAGQATQLSQTRFALHLKNKVGMKHVLKALDWLNSTMLVVSGIAFAIMAIHIVADVCGRYLFKTPLPGTVEIVADYYMVTLVFLPLAYVQKRDKHFVAGIFTDHLPLRMLRRVTGVTDLAMAAVTALLTWAAVSAAIHATRSGEHVQMAEFLLPVWPGRWLVPLGIGAMCLYALTNGLRRLVPALGRELPPQIGSVR
ncbi:MAG: hypothetical protein A3G25_21620 [Betaproteobacteria bacterium RIFCSPLOWO2_12_FULL_63_13]|nr:MAG: hypothetical protein A3G25_21620 [Betaproteobacteria bacterium RIFCSPLOWO2_12_FULL_63_13]